MNEHDALLQLSKCVVVVKKLKTSKAHALRKNSWFKTKDFPQVKFRYPYLIYLRFVIPTQYPRWLLILHSAVRSLKSIYWLLHVSKYSNLMKLIICRWQSGRSQTCRCILIKILDSYFLFTLVRSSDSLNLWRLEGKMLELNKVLPWELALSSYDVRYSRR